MTTHPIDDEAFLWLDRLDDAVRRRAYDCTCQVGGAFRAAAGVPRIRHALAEIRRAHRNMAERVGVAEHRATRAEAQSAIRGRAVVMYRERARAAEARIKAWAQQYDYDMCLESDRADAAEARIKAVRDVLDADEHVTRQMGTLGRWQPDTPAIAHDTIRRALDATTTQETR